MSGITKLSWLKYQLWDSAGVSNRLVHVNNGEKWDPRVQGERSAGVGHRGRIGTLYQAGSQQKGMAFLSK